MTRELRAVGSNLCDLAHSNVNCLENEESAYRTFEPVKDLIIMNYLVSNEIIGNLVRVSSILSASKAPLGWHARYLMVSIGYP